jgi:hypothetical protein
VQRGLVPLCWRTSGHTVLKYTTSGGWSRKVNPTGKKKTFNFVRQTASKDKDRQGPAIFEPQQISADQYDQYYIRIPHIRKRKAHAANLNTLGHQHRVSKASGCAARHSLNRQVHW